MTGLSLECEQDPGETKRDSEQHNCISMLQSNPEASLVPGLGSSKTLAWENASDLEEMLLQRCNILHLAASAAGTVFLARWDTKLMKIYCKGIGNRRDCMDMLGKLPLALKALDAGIAADKLLVDVAQAGGLFEASDGMLRAADGRLEPLEIKVSCSVLLSIKGKISTNTS